MGSASRVTPGRPHNDSLAASLPIENSPPGIQTIPSGAGAGAGDLFGKVGSNAEAVAISTFSRPGALGRRSAEERNLPEAARPTPIAITTAAIHHPALEPGPGAVPPFPLGLLLMPSSCPEMQRFGRP